MAMHIIPLWQSLQRLAPDRPIDVTYDCTKGDLITLYYILYCTKHGTNYLLEINNADDACCYFRSEPKYMFIHSYKRNHLEILTTQYGSQEK